MQDIYSLVQGTRPLLISMPHCGTLIPEALRIKLVERAALTEDADWHMQQLYSFAEQLGASLLVPRYSRYVIDLNRPPDDTPMYPGASNTELCPTRFFTGEPLYLQDQTPDPIQKAQRLQYYWQPYHDALNAELNRLQTKHGQVLLWDAHSIRSELPWLFEGRLPDLNIGTANGVSVDRRISDAVMQVCTNQNLFSNVLNGRFKGGYITRHYGQPQLGIHAIQLEMCQSLYMNEQYPFEYSPKLANRVIPVMEQMLKSALVTVESLQ